MMAYAWKSPRLHPRRYQIDSTDGVSLFSPKSQPTRNVVEMMVVPALKAVDRLDVYVSAAR